MRVVREPVDPRAGPACLSLCRVSNFSVLLSSADLLFRSLIVAFAKYVMPLPVLCSTVHSLSPPRHLRFLVGCIARAYLMIVNCCRPVKVGGLLYMRPSVCQAGPFIVLAMPFGLSPLPFELAVSPSEFARKVSAWNSILLRLLAPPLPLSFFSLSSFFLFRILRQVFPCDRVTPRPSACGEANPSCILPRERPLSSFLFRHPQQLPLLQTDLASLTF